MRPFPRYRLVVLLMVLIGTAASAQMLVPRTEVGTKDLPPLQVKYQHVTVDIDNQVARTSIEQVFINGAHVVKDGTYDADCRAGTVLRRAATA